MIAQSGIPPPRRSRSSRSSNTRICQPSGCWFGSAFPGTFYRWYNRYLTGGPEALEDRFSAPSRVWNRIPTDIHGQIIEMALENSELSPRELAVQFTDEKGYFISEASVCRLLKAHDLITSPAYVVIKAAREFHTKTSRPNQMWQTVFTYFKIVGPPVSMLRTATAILRPFGAAVLLVATYRPRAFLLSDFDADQ